MRNKLHKRFEKFADDFIESSAKHPEGRSKVLSHSSKFCLGDFDQIDQYQFEEDIVFTGSRKIVFNDCVFNGDLDFSNFLNHITFSNCILNGKTNFQTKHYLSNSFLNCEIKMDVLKLTAGQLIFSNSIAKTIFVSTNVQSVGIDGDETEIELLEIGSVKPNAFSLDIKNVADITELRIHNDASAISYIEITNSSIKRINIVRAVIRLKIVSLINCDYIHLSNFINDTVQIINCHLDELKIIDSNLRTGEIGNSNISTIKFTDIESSNGQLSLYEINSLQNLTFSKVKNVTFDISEIRIEKLCLRKTEFDSWHIGYIDWAKNFSLFLDDFEKEKKQDNLELIETSRKLKTYFKERGNLIDSEVFRISELDSYFKYLLIKLKIWDITSSQVIDLIVLGSNKLFSKFGNSPIRPLVFLFSFHCLWFFLLISNNMALGFEICFEQSNCDFSSDLLAFYFNLLNPIHKLVTSSGEIIYSTIDFIMRISSGYFIYYFIQATRKFGRR